MIIISIPPNNISERKYIIDILLGEFLGLEYKIEVGNQKLSAYEIELEENGNKLIFEDHFFNKFIQDLEYLNVDNIPKNVEYTKNDFIVEEDIPVIYGTDKVAVNDKLISCGIDIFASSFFMLTRWEEYANKNRDEHNRFPAYESLAYKQDFLDRSIVNEYVEMLKNMLYELGLEQKTRTRSYQLVLTHDVDFIYKWDTFSKFMRHLVGDLVLRKSIKELFLSTYYYIQVKLKKKNDPFDTFDYLMDVSENLNTKSYFFFMAKGITKFDNFYKSDSAEALNLVSKIKKRGHYVGIHPSYNAYNNLNQLENEKAELEENLDSNISFGREHFLRFEVPTTWQIWEDNSMSWDSTVGYADKEGFRCGVCYEYRVFNILTRKKLNLKEKPLIVMEMSLATQNNMTSIEMDKKIKSLICKVKKYNGEFVFLWHNSSFNIKEWRDYKNTYENVLMSRP